MNRQEQTASLPWKDLESSNLERIAWTPHANVNWEQMANPDKLEGTLWVEFVRKAEDEPRRVYFYENVPQWKHERILEAKSAGSMFGKLIRREADIEFGVFSLEEDEEDVEAADRIEKLEVEVTQLKSRLDNLERAVKGIMRFPGKPTKG